MTLRMKDFTVPVFTRPAGEPDNWDGRDLWCGSVSRYKRVTAL